MNIEKCIEESSEYLKTWKMYRKTMKKVGLLLPKKPFPIAGNAHLVKKELKINEGSFK